MTLSTTENNHQFVGNNVTLIFSWTYKTLSVADIEVYLDGVLQIADFTLELNEEQDTTPGGDLTFLVLPPATGVNVNIVRNVPLTQLVDYQPFDAFPAETHEAALDRLTMQTQQLQELLDRVTIPPPDAEPGSALVEGDLTVEGMVILGDVDSGGQLHNFAQDKGLTVSGGNASSDGGGIQMFGSAHPTSPGVVRLKSGVAVFLDWDESTGSLAISTGTGTKTLAVSIDDLRTKFLSDIVVENDQPIISMTETDAVADNKRLNIFQSGEVFDMRFVDDSFVSGDGFLQVTRDGNVSETIVMNASVRHFLNSPALVIPNMPTSAGGLLSGTLWNNGGVVNIAP